MTWRLTSGLCGPQEPGHESNAWCVTHPFRTPSLLRPPLLSRLETHGPSPPRSPSPKVTENKQCYSCGGLGHLVAECPSIRVGCVLVLPLPPSRRPWRTPDPPTTPIAALSTPRAPSATTASSSATSRARAPTRRPSLPPRPLTVSLPLPSTARSLRSRPSSRPSRLSRARSPSLPASVALRRAAASWAVVASWVAVWVRFPRPAGAPRNGAAEADR